MTNAEQQGYKTLDLEALKAEEEEEKPRLEDENLETNPVEDSDENSIEVFLEESDKDDDDKEVLEDKEEDEPEVKEEEKSDSDEEKDKDSSDTKGKGSRAQRRIRQLAREKNELAEKLKSLEDKEKEFQAKIEKLEETNRLTKKESLDVQKTLLEDKIKNLSALRRRAREEGDLDREEELDGILSEARINHRILSEQSTEEEVTLEEPKKAQEPSKKEEVPEESTPKFSREEALDQLPDAAYNWAEQNEWFLQDPNKTQVALTLSSQLESQGYDIESPEHYELLNQKLDVIFPSETSPKKEKEAPKKEAPKKARSPVGTPSKGAVTNKGRKSFKLTPEMQEHADLLGLSYKDYAEAYLWDERQEEQRSSGKSRTRWKSVFKEGR